MSKTLSFTIEHQQQTEWCWAAVSKSISSFFNAASSWTQCSIVNAELRRTDCCSNGGSALCNSPWFLDRALKRVMHFRTISNAASGSTAVQQEIGNDDPMGARIQWAQGGGHFVGVYGYDDTDATKFLLVIGDPWYGVSIVAIDQFTNNYLGMGSWSHSYFTSP